MKPFDSNTRTQIVLDCQAAHIGARRAEPQFALEVVELAMGAERQHLHTAIVEIACPTLDPQVPGRPLSEHAIPDALYSPAYQVFAHNSRSHKGVILPISAKENP